MVGRISSNMAISDHFGIWRSRPPWTYLPCLAIVCLDKVNDACVAAMSVAALA